MYMCMYMHMHIIFTSSYVLHVAHFTDLHNYTYVHVHRESVHLEASCANDTVDCRGSSSELLSGSRLPKLSGSLVVASGSRRSWKENDVAERMNK